MKSVIEKQIFTATRLQVKRAKKWIERHDVKHIDPKSGKREVGAIGGAYTWCFTPTSIGTILHIKCACGKKLDLTEYGLF